MRHEEWGRPRLVILGLDTVRTKLLYQTRFLADRGFDVDVLAAHRNAGSIRSDPSVRILEVVPGAVPRLRQVAGHLWRERTSVHHVELYVGGRYAAIYAVIARLLRLRLLVVERGDLRLAVGGVYPRTLRWSIYASNRLAHGIWFKEPYMERLLARWGSRKLHFLPNAVPLPDAPGSRARTLDLLWVNRLIPERHPDWLAGAIRQEGSWGMTAAIVGFSADEADAHGVREAERRVREELAGLPGVELRGFAEPAPYFRRARFFVLPGDVTFGNYALLEAMAHGVVPIVTETEGVDRLVHDGVNGLVAEHSAQGVAAVVRSALELPEHRWREMSAAARATIAESYSLEPWGDRLLELYRSL